MFNIGPLELMVILVVALVVVGPKRLPEVGRTIGKSLREFRKATDEVKSSFDFNLDDDFEPDTHPTDAKHVEALPDTDEFPARHVETLPDSDELPAQRFDGFEEPDDGPALLDGHVTALDAEGTAEGTEPDAEGTEEEEPEYRRPGGSSEGGAPPAPSPPASPPAAPEPE
jgi:TatA/E family protein of Tat protein translocase